MSGVEAERLSGKVRPSSIPLLLLDELSPVERQTTDVSGEVTFGKSGAQFALNPRSQNERCGRAFVAATWSGAKVRYPDENREVLIKPVNGVVEVPLGKPAPGKDHKADRRQGSGSPSAASRTAGTDADWELLRRAAAESRGTSASKSLSADSR